MRTNATTTALKLHFVMDFKKLKIYIVFSPPYLNVVRTAELLMNQKVVR